MDRITLEKAWLDCYDFKNIPVSEKVENISKMPSHKMAADVYSASMKMRDEGINWCGSDFEEELLEVMMYSDSRVKDSNTHITCKDYEDIKNAINNFLKENNDKDELLP